MTRRAQLLPLATAFAIGCALPASGGWRWAAAALLPLAFSPPLAPLAFAAAGALAAGAVERGARVPTATRPAGDGEVLRGRVASVPDRLDGRVRFLLREPSGRTLQVTAPPPAWPLAWGDEVWLAASVREPEGARNPGGRDQAALLRARGIAALAHARGPPLRAGPPSPLCWLEAGRTRFAAAALASLPRREAALVAAMGSGDRSALDPPTTEAFARSGLAHILSVSGLHLAVVALGSYRLLRALLLRLDAVAARLDPRRLAAAAALPVAALYALATGADVPVVRSAVAAALLLAAALLDREPDALSALAAGLLLVLASDPGALRDVSLQLSFASVAGLAVLTGPIRRALPLRPGRSRAGRACEAALGAAAAGLAATLATAPLVAFHFRRLSLLAPAANLLGVPVGSALTVVAAAAALAAAAAPPLALPLLWVARPLASLLLAVNDLFAAPAWAAIGLASPGPLGLGAAYLGLGAAAVLRGRRRLAGALLFAVSLWAPGAAREAAAARRGLLEVTFLSVGQGDAAVLRLPDGAAVLVDGGGDPRGRRDPGARDLLPFLRDAGVARPWLAVLTHPHPDHALGLATALRAAPPGSFLGNGRTGDGEVAAALAALPLRRWPRGASLERAGVRLLALGPPPDAGHWSENDASLVLRVEHGRVAFLLLGDVEAEGERALLAQAAPLAADVVKVAHHGSRTSSAAALVAAAGARWAVISVGRNPWGLPAPEVAERWASAGATVLRTDEGAIRFLSDGERVWRAEAGGAIDAWRLWNEGPRREPRPAGAPRSAPRPAQAGDGR